MAGGNAHQRAVQKTALDRMVGKAAAIVTQQIQPSPVRTETKTVRQRLFDFVEHPWFIAALTTVGALVGFFYTPILVACGVGIMLAFHRADVVRPYRPSVQITAYAGLCAVATFALYGAFRLIKDHASIPTAREIAAEIIKLLPQSRTIPQATIVPNPTPHISVGQIAEIKDLSKFIGEPDEISLRKEFGFPEMMDTNIRGIINNLNRWRRTGELHHYQLPAGDTLIDNRFAKGHIRRQGGGFVMDFDDTTVYFVLLPKDYSDSLARLKRIENSSELPGPIIAAVKGFDGAVSQNAIHLIEVLSRAMNENKDYYFEYDDPQSPFFHEIDGIYLDSFVLLRPKADRVRNAVRAFVGIN